MFHGVAGKYNLDAPVDLAPTIASFDCLMFVNADRRRRYIDAGLIADDLERAPLVGYPKLDCLVDGSLDRASVARSLGFVATTPTVIYAPTWSPQSSLNSMGLEVVDRLAAEGLQVIVKLHDRSYDRRERGSGGVDWAQQLARYDGHRLVRIARESNGCPFMIAADAMVSDHSSIAFEYMLLDRPLVIIDRPALIERASISREKVARVRAGADVAAILPGSRRGGDALGSGARSATGRRLRLSTAGQDERPCISIGVACGPIDRPLSRVPREPCK